MEQITLEDKVDHYTLKLKRVRDDISSSRRKLKIALNAIEDGWQGQVADACRDKLEDVRHDLKRASLELSDASKTLSKIKSI